MGELAFMVVLAVVGVVFYLDTGTFRVSLMDRSGGAAMFPRAVIGLLLALVAMRIVAILLQKKREPFVFAEMFQGDRLVYLLALLALIMTIKPVGFLPAMGVFLCFTVNYFHYRTVGGLGALRAVAARSVAMLGLAAAVYYFFTGVLHVMLPAGIMG